MRGRDLCLRALCDHPRLRARLFQCLPGLLGRRAGRDHLAFARDDRGLELLARRSLGRDTLVELGTLDRDLLACEPRCYVGLRPRLFQEGDPLDEFARLAVAAARCRLGLHAQPSELVARLTRRPLRRASRGSLCLQPLLQPCHRLAAGLRGAFGVLAPAALFAHDGGIDRRFDGRRLRDRPRRRLRDDPLRRPRRDLLGPREIDDRAVRLQREREPVLIQQCRRAR